MAMWMRPCSLICDVEGDVVQRFHIFCTCDRCARAEPVKCVWCDELVMGMGFSYTTSAREEDTAVGVHSDEVIRLEARDVRDREGGDDES